MKSRVRRTASRKSVKKREQIADEKIDERILQYKKLQRKHREDMAKEKHTLSVLQDMLREREQLHTLHEQKVVDLKKKYETKYSELGDKERTLRERERDIATLEKDNRKLLIEHARSKRLLASLHDEERIARSEIRRVEKNLDQLHRNEAAMQQGTHKVQGSLKNMQKAFDLTNRRLQEMSAAIEDRKKELGEVSLRLQEDQDTHLKVLSQITHHSAKEVRSRLRRAEQYIKAGRVSHARLEYEQIREWYRNLSVRDKKRLVKPVHKLRERLTHKF